MSQAQTEPRAAHAPLGLEKTRVVRARTTQGAVAALADAVAKGERAMLLAGGTDVIVDRHLLPPARATTVDLVVDVTGIPAFHAIDEDASAGERRLRFAGGVTYWDLRESALVARDVPMLCAMAKDVGAVQIQTRGTLAGNVASASPAADGVAALLALEARLHLESVQGARVISLRDALLGYRKTAIAPAEIVSAIDVRVPAAGARVTWRKVGTRLAQAISKVALAAVIERDAAGVVTRASFGAASVAATTHALPNVAAFVLGKKNDAIDASGLDAAVANDIQPIDDVRSTGEYRLHVARALVRQALDLA